MPLYISNTNRIESLENKLRGSKSTTTTTVTPPQYQWLWAMNGPGTNDVTNSYDVNYIRDSNPALGLMEVFGTASLFYPNEFPPQAYGIGIDWATAATISPTGSLWRSPVGVDFQVKPDIFGKIATFTNTNPGETYMLASYVPYSSSYMTFEFVPPSSSIQRCVTYPAYCYFTLPITGSGDTSWDNPVNESIFGANCQYDIDCQCELCYNKSGQSGTTAIFNQGEPCSTATTTTSTTTTSTTSTTTSTTTTTAASTYEVEYLIVAGGGGGGNQDSSNSNLGSGGGGAGGYISGSTFVTSSQSYSVTVGLGGGAQTSGGDSIVFDLTAIGGGFGAPAGTTDLSGGTGGSGGGGGSRGGSLAPNAPGSGTSPQGFGGGVGTLESVGAGGGGGGATSAGSTGTANLYDGGGAGKLWFDGVTYSRGGDAAGRGTVKYNPTNGSANTGNGGGGIKQTGGGSGGSGGSGVVIVRYAGSPRGTGGTVTESGGYTYHKFVSSSDYVA